MMTVLKYVRRAASEFLYTERRHVFRMLRSINFPFWRALFKSTSSLADYRGYFRDSGLRLMLYREHRDPADIFSECYFGRNYLGNPVECVVDVGAHAGSYSWACYTLLKPCSIYLYEPNGDLVPRLHSLSENMSDTTVVIRGVAVGRERTRIGYRKTESPLLNSPLAFNEGERALLHDYAQSLIENVTVEQVTLDEELQDEPAIDYLKIDTQGYEMSVLQGAQKTLAKTRVVMIESNFLSIYEDGSTFCQIHQFLMDAGFLLVQLDAPSRSHGLYVWTDALYVSRALV